MKDHKEIDTDPTGARIQFYGRRKGKPLKAGRQNLLETLLPRLKFARPQSRQSIDIKSLLPQKSDVWLEIGFGGGEHLAAQAAAHLDVGFIGCEVFINGVASLLKCLEANGADNVRIFHDDVRHLLPHLPDASLGRIYLLFPDPWPKTRHAKRRFISPEMLSELARLLVDGGELHVASDHPVYVRWTLTHATDHPLFQWPAREPGDWRNRPADGFPTRYEEKAVAVGRKPAYLRFIRRSRTP
jgi:tRNA (guanine-N7-)-methyltransferase